jgi:hypothetical protein
MEASMMEITGGCFCRAITYRAEIDENYVGLCHCRDCQLFSGSAFRTAAFVEPGKFEFLTGTPKHFEKTAGSGKVRTMAFCGDCGSHLCSLPSEASDSGAFISLRVASADQFDQLKPVFEVFCKSQVDWLPTLAGTRRFEEMPE